MAVGTTHFAFGDLFQNSSQRMLVVNHPTYVGYLLTLNMIEVKNDRISFPAIHTWVRGEIRLNKVYSDVSNPVTALTLACPAL
jgi:hypothetical protein